MESKKYPIYQITAKWSEDGVQDPLYPNWYKGLPEGKTWNSSSHNWMTKEELTKEELENKVVEFITHIKKDRKPIGHLTTSAKLLKHDTWCLQWFNHYTFDVGQTDDEVLDSFEQYVRKYEHMQNRSYENYPENYQCLMGAEDRWRWRGENLGEENYTPTPCRCQACKEQGVIRINH